MSNMEGKFVITVEPNVDGYTLEKLEDKIRNVLEEEGVYAEIDDLYTGNVTVTRRGEMGKKGKEDTTVHGELILGEKIWFNDAMRCRLRICGFSREQTEKLRGAKFVDLTIMDYIDDDTQGVAIHISPFDKDIDTDPLMKGANQSTIDKSKMGKCNMEDEEFIQSFDKTDLDNLIYKEVIQILEPLEGKGKYTGNTHHLAQEICSKLSPVIMEKMDLAARQKIKVEQKFNKEG